MKKARKNIKDSWNSFVIMFKNEKRETKKAIKVLKRLLHGDEPTPEEIKLLKTQSLELAKIIGVMSLGAVSIAIPIALEKILNKWDISIMPKEKNNED